MGVVYKARDRRTGREVALKVMQQGMRASAEKRARFLREGEAARRIHHPNVARCYELGELELQNGKKALFLALEFVPGRDLYQRLSFEELSQRQVADAGRQLADGLAAIHAAGVLHRDLKSTNVKLSRDGRAKILDFGLAKILDGADDEAGNVYQSSVGTVLGTAHFSAPEQLLSEQLDERSDLFSLGVILYQMTSGRLPFRGETVRDLLAEIKAGPAPLRDLAPGVSPQLEEIILRLLAYSREDRFKNAAELSLALRRLLEDGGEELERDHHRSATLNINEDSTATSGRSWTRFLKRRSRRQSTPD